MRQMILILILLIAPAFALTTGCVVKATPAVAVADGCVVMTNWLAAAGLTTTSLEVAGVTPLALVLKLRFIVSAMS